MTHDNIYVLLLCLYSLALLGLILLLLRRAQDRPVYALLFAGMFLNFLGLIRFWLFHDSFGSLLLNVAGYTLMLASGIWILIRAFQRMRRRHA